MRLANEHWKLCVSMGVRFMLLGPIVGLAVFAIPLAIIGLFDATDIFGSIVLGLSMFLIAVFYAYLLSFLPAFFAGLSFQIYYLLVDSKFLELVGMRCLIGAFCGFFSQAAYLLIISLTSRSELHHFFDGVTVLMLAAVAGAVCGWSVRDISISV